MKALVKVGYACNENCLFCHARERRGAEASAALVHARVERAAQLGHDMVVFSGGEPTLRPELPAWAAHAARLGLDVGLVTNGLLLAYPALLDRLLASRLRYVYVSLHAPVAEVHDGLVRARSFDTVLRALRAMAGRVADLTVNCVVTTRNVALLDGLVDLVATLPGTRVKFSLLEPKGGADEHFDRLAPPLAEVGESTTRALRRAQALGVPAGHENIPFCHLPGVWHLFDDLRAHGFTSMAEADEPDFFPVDPGSLVQPPACAGCALRGPCPGLYAGWLERRGDADLRPILDRPRSNSFNYVFERLVATDAPADRCPLLPGGILPWDRGRDLFVAHNGRVGRYHTPKRDFSDAEIRRVKHDLGQVYLDASTTKEVPDDFARDLVKLRRSPLCAPCPERDRCTGLFEPQFEDLFGRDDARVRQLVSALGGDVLDVGCGEGPYQALLAPLVASGRVRYTGLDPDEGRLARLAARMPAARLHAGTAEGLADGDALPGPFDHVLVLRSWNHFADPRRALQALARRLRPGGTLLVVDNTAFGLARTRAQAERADRSPSGFEHWRNDLAADAAALAASAGLSVLECCETRPEASNQWLLRLCAAPADALR